MADASSTPPGPHPEPPADETARRPEARKDTLAASGRSDFRHGRFEPGQRLGSRYRIVALLGQGGMGEVYRADDLELGQSVALKFLPERVVADESWLRRFRNEVRTARHVTHTNVCRIYDIAGHDGHVFLSMEYVDGEDLAGVLRRLGRPSRDKAIEIARQICMGLATAHDAKILHRDLKPANIMIDGRGRVRITDFGLAGFLDELEGVEARAGTPAYMAPEQLTRGEVSVRSDIYTLGLILHELFTGKCVFDSNDIEALKRTHTRGSIPAPSSITEDIDPAVERVILRCLEEDPGRRPQSVYQVLAALPGGDPLAAALAAGETPAPELVAHARDAGGLQPAVAIGLVVATLASVALTYLVSSMTTIMPERSPARLSVVAEQIMEELGYGDLPRHSVSGLDGDIGLGRPLRPDARPNDRLGPSPWPPKYRYWRRWSDGGFLPTNIHFPQEFTIDAPTHDAGTTATVALDATGRLLALSVPPALVVSESAVTGEVDWSPLFERAQLDLHAATPVAPAPAPSVHCDTVVAWRVKPSVDAQEPVTVITGAVGGRPNYFEFTGLHEQMLPNHAHGLLSAGPTELTWMAFTLLMIVLAYRNYRAGRADRRNAFRGALFVGGLYALSEIAVITLGGSAPVTQVYALTAGRAAGHFLLHAIEVWIYYLAIEPYVRRIRPHMLIALVRVFSGRWRDPAIGREVLIGLAAACVLVVVATIGPAAVRAVGGVTTHVAAPDSLRIILSPSHYLSNMAHSVAMAVLAGICYAGVVVLIRLVLRRPWPSAAVAIAAIAFLEYWMFHVAGSRWSSIILALALGGCVVWLITRIGVLAAIVFFFVAYSMGLFGLAFDAWSAPYLVAWLATLLAIVAYGFWASLAGQPIFKDMLTKSSPTAA